MERHTCLMIFIFFIYGGCSLYAVVTSLYAVTYSLYSVPSPFYVVHVVLQTVLFSLYAVLTAFYAVIFSLYAVFFLLCAVANSLYAVLFSLCTEVKSLYAVPFSCKAFSRYTRCFFHYVRWLFHYTRCFFHYTHGTSFSLDLKRGQLRMEAKMAATTRILQLILKKLCLGHLTELFRRDNNTTDMICNQQGTGGHDEFAITIMLVCHDPD